MAVRKSIISLFAVFMVMTLAAGLVLVLFKTDRQSTANVPRPVRKVRVGVVVMRPRTFTDFTEAFADIEPRKKGVVSAQITGPVVRLAPWADPGHTVKRGQALAWIEDVRYRLSLKKAEATKAKLKAMLTIERNENKRRTALFQVAEKRLRLAESEFHRKQRLFKKALISKQALELSDGQVALQRAEFERAKSALENRQARIQSITAELRAAEAEIMRLKEDLKDTVMRAPFEGVVSERFVEEGDQVVPGKKAFTIVDVSAVKVMARVPSNLVPSIREGMEVEVLAQALPGKAFLGKVQRVYPQADPKNRTFTVEVLVMNDQGTLLLPGMFCSVRMLTARMDNVLVVPREAVLEDGDRAFVYVVDLSTQRAQKREVVISHQGKDELVISAGLREGDLLVTDGKERLSDGALLVTSF